MAVKTHTGIDFFYTQPLSDLLEWIQVYLEVSKK